MIGVFDLCPALKRSQMTLLKADTFIDDRTSGFDAYSDECCVSASLFEITQMLSAHL
jgi:hypothetical protein